MLTCVLEPGCGRVVVAAHDIAAGEIVFTEEAYTVAPNVDHPKKKYCVFCAAPIRAEFARCEACESAYCTESCYSKHHQSHRNHGECACIRFTQSLKPKIATEDFDTFQMTCLLIARCVSEGKEKALTREAAPESDEIIENTTSPPGVQTVGLGAESTSPLQFLNTFTPPEVAVTSTYDHVECLVTNVKDIDPEIVSDFSRLYDIYMEGTQKRKLMNKLGTERIFFPPTVSRTVFVSLTCAFLCNGFGFWDTAGEKQATAVYPQSSYFNHSCAPNLGRRHVKGSRVQEFFAARTVLKGEQLCISYVDVRLPAAERKAKLKGTYTFMCQCCRCVPGVPSLIADTTIGGLVPPLCVDCKAKVLQPLEDGTYICPCCDMVQSVDH